MSYTLPSRVLWDLCDRCGKHGRELIATVQDGVLVEREGPNDCTHPMAAEAARLAIEHYRASLVKASGVDVHEMATRLIDCQCGSRLPEWPTCCCEGKQLMRDDVLDALRTAIAQAVAREGKL